MLRSCKAEAALIATLLLLGWGGMNAAWAKQYVELKGTRFPDQLSTEAGRLDLQGAGLLKWGIWFDVYAAAYYVDPADPRHRKLEIAYFVSIEAQQIRSAAESHLREQQSAAAYTALKPALDRLHDAMRDVERGDRYALTLQGERLILEHNGTEVLRLHDQALGQAYLNLWLGDDPLDTRLRLSLLGDQPRP